MFPGNLNINSAQPRLGGRVSRVGGPCDESAERDTESDQRNVVRSNHLLFSPSQWSQWSQWSPETTFISIH